MAVSTLISKLRKKSKLSEKEFAELFEISENTLADWENGNSKPNVAQAARLAKHFRVSADRLLESGLTEAVVMPKGNEMLPAYEKLHDWELYSKSLHFEYMQSIEEGLDIEQYKPLFDAIIALPPDEYKEKMADVLFDIVSHAPTVQGYPYHEPSDLAGIFSLCKEYPLNAKALTEEELREKIKGAWYGRICGCLLGKPVEGVSCENIRRLLEKTGNYPMTRYIRQRELTEEMIEECRALRDDFCADIIDFAPVDDDTNYVALAQVLIRKYGRDFQPSHVAQLWTERQGKNAYCTAERIAYCNFIRGFHPPYSAMHKNSYREWIGAQIRGDYFGYINPGDPKTAAEMAWRDASISHIKNGIYGEMFASAMIACAAVTDNIEDIILGGLSYVPVTSRLYEKIQDVLTDYHNGVGFYEAIEKLKKEYDPANSHGWTHTIPNAAIVVLSLLHGNGDFGYSICRAVEVGYDTDCNGATVGSILGIRNGFSGIGEVWTKPVGGKLDTSIFGVGLLDIDKAVERTMKHIAGDPDEKIRR
ncbi:MAG: ADP-ribosylglycohydrolase family protein [Clostridia bacterium]|nr:ADP-ribosylglycohydrolase family protein [Clostridia bacterium]